jgi:hypothetical protein
VPVAVGLLADALVRLLIGIETVLHLTATIDVYLI